MKRIFYIIYCSLYLISALPANGNRDLTLQRFTNTGHEEYGLFSLCSSIGYNYVAQGKYKHLRSFVNFQYQIMDS